MFPRFQKIGIGIAHSSDTTRVVTVCPSQLILIAFLQQTTSLNKENTGACAIEDVVRIASYVSLNQFESLMLRRRLFKNRRITQHMFHLIKRFFEFWLLFSPLALIVRHLVLLVDEYLNLV